MIKHLFSKQKWLFKYIPSTKTENEDLIRSVLFGTLVHFVDDQKGFDNVLWTEDEGHKEVHKKLLDAYMWVKEKRSLLVDKIQQMRVSLPCVNENDMLWKYVNENNISEIILLEKKLERMDKDYLKDIIEYSDYLIVI